MNQSFLRSVLWTGRQTDGSGPQGLRHTAITAALDAFNGDVRKARSFSRHANLATVALYDDARHDRAGAAAQVLDDLMA